MNKQQLGLEIATGILQTGVEGGYESISCSSNGDYPSMGMSQWEGLGGRGDYLLGCIPGGDRFAGRTYSDLKSVVHEDNEGTPDYDEDGVITDIDKLSALLNTPEGQEAQNQILIEDCTEMYVPALAQVPGFWDSRCFIYAGIWCPTNHICVMRFLQNRADRGITDLATLRDIFQSEYYIAADVGEKYAEGYANRAVNTFNYAASCDLSAYGVEPYQG